MPNKADIPLHIYQMLEEEYVYLYGPIPNTPRHIKLPDEVVPGGQRRVEAALDWSFREGHVKNPRLLAARILSSSAGGHSDLPPDIVERVSDDDWTKDKLKAYLRRTLGPLPEELLMSANVNPGQPDHAPASLEGKLNEALNTLLEDAHLYARDRFDGQWVSGDSRGLISVHTTEGPLQGKDLARLNRLLLEDAFPELEKIHRIRSAAICSRLHEVRPAALCLSGGGLRSATFSVGLLQGLARHKLLDQFDYLSTVSGGGFAGSWLAAWARRHPEGIIGVSRELGSEQLSDIVDPEPAPLLYLRENISFLTSKPGILSADTWTTVGIYLRNLLLNWAVFIPLLMGLLMLPRAFLAVTLSQPMGEPVPLAAVLMNAPIRPQLMEWLEAIPQHQRVVYYPQPLFQTSYFGFPLYPRHLLLLFGYLLGAWALAYMGFTRPGARELLSRSVFWRDRADQANFLRWCWLPLLLSAFCLTTYWAWSRSARPIVTPLSSFLAFGMMFTFTGWLISAIVLRRFSRLRGVNFSEPISILLAGNILGLIFWMASSQTFLDPRIGYGVVLRDDVADPQQTFQAMWSSLYNGDAGAWSWSAWTTEWYVCLAVPLVLIAFWGATALFVGVSGRMRGIDEADRQWWARFGAWLLIAAIVWAGVNTLVIFGPVLILDYPQVLGPLGGFSGLLALILARSSKILDLTKLASGGGRLAAGLRDLLPRLALFFLAFLVAATSGLLQFIVYLFVQAAAGAQTLGGWGEFLTNAPSFDEYVRYVLPVTNAGTASDPLIGAKVAHMNIIHHTSLWFVTTLCVVMLLIGFVFARRINLNVFALHDGYRNRDRLVQVFLGASRPSASRRPHTFTGFDPADNISIQALRPGLLTVNDILDPGKLAEGLVNERHELSARLANSGLLKNASAASGRPPTPALLEAIVSDLNCVLVNESLWEKLGDKFLPRDELNRVGGVLMTSGQMPLQYRLMVNRLILEHAYPGTLAPADFSAPPYKLFQVVNTAVNLIRGRNISWRSRETAPFSITPLHCGSIRLGYRNSNDYGGKAEGISLGTAAAISGASMNADSEYRPNSPAMTLLLTLFSMRVGWWFGNPGHAGRHTYSLSAPRSSVQPILWDSFGMLDEHNPYVYLSDGAHFESLGLYEMVLRRCHVIVLSDCTMDEDYDFDDIGDAIRTIRVELGIPIEFHNIPIGDPSAGGKSTYFTIGRIRYSVMDIDASDGVLLYIKPAVYGDEPRDILTYKRKHPAFPHEQMAADQPFDKQQFESYRALGSYIADRLCGGSDGPLDLFQIIERAYHESKSISPPEDEDFNRWLESLLPSHPASAG